jgi:glutamate-5-semialdehyde dehydrogenase
MSISDQLVAARRATKLARTLDSKFKSDVIHEIAEQLERDVESILQVNTTEVESAVSAGSSQTEIDRLTLDHNRMKSIIEATHAVADLDDPVGDVLESWEQPSGITINKVRVPLGVVGIIYENRPNVTVDAAAICLRSGNVSVLRGSSGARETNRAIVASIHKALASFSLDDSLVTFIDDPSREGAQLVMQARGLVDVLIPRGGPSLIEAIQANATVPYIVDGAGNCHVYIDKDADLDMAEKIVVNSKTQRNSVCNAAESLVVHRDIAREFISRISNVLAKKDVELVGDQCAVDFGEARVDKATLEDFGTEFLGPKMSIVVVESIDGAINHINKYSTGHTECIVTDNPESATKFLSEIDAAVVMHNTSTRFTDGERFGFGAEIGISTQKLHARGPMALKELTTYQYHVRSNGAIV